MNIMSDKKKDTTKDETPAPEIKMAPEELTALQQIRNEYARVTSLLGQIHLERKGIETRLAELEEAETQLFIQHTQVKTAEGEIANQITVKYGDGVIDAETGVFTPKSD